MIIFADISLSVYYINSLSFLQEKGLIEKAHKKLMNEYLNLRIFIFIKNINEKYFIPEIIVIE